MRGRHDQGGHNDISFLAKRLCFLTFPVSEIRKAVNLYGLRGKKLDNNDLNTEPPELEIISKCRYNAGASRDALGEAHRTATGTTSQTSVISYHPDRKDSTANPQRLSGRVRHALETFHKSQPTRKGTLPKAGRPFQQGLSVVFITFRAFITISIWIPLFLLEYICVMIYWGLHRCIKRLVSSKENSRHTGDLDFGRDNTGDRSMRIKWFLTYPLTILLHTNKDRHWQQRHGIHNRQTMQESKFLDGILLLWQMGMSACQLGQCTDGATRTWRREEVHVRTEY